MGIKNISLPDELQEKTEKEAKNLGLSFSDYVRLVLTHYTNGFKFDIVPNQEIKNVPNKEL